MLGPGLLESAYEAALAFELRIEGLKIKTQVAIPLIYRDVNMDIGYRIDILVVDKVIIEIKSVEALAQVHYKQIITYLKLADKKLGLLFNFNTDKIDKSVYRKVNGL